MGLIRRLCVEDAAGTELTSKLAENLKESLADNKVNDSDIKCVMLCLLLMAQLLTE